MKEAVNGLLGEAGKALKSVHDVALLLGKDVIDLSAENTRLKFEVERLERALAEAKQASPEVEVITKPANPALLKSKSIKSFKTETLLCELERRGYVVLMV